MAYQIHNLSNGRQEISTTPEEPPVSSGTIRQLGPWMETNAIGSSRHAPTLWTALVNSLEIRISVR
jgi:hypothetical protein